MRIRNKIRILKRNRENTGARKQDVSYIIFYQQQQKTAYMYVLCMCICVCTLLPVCICSTLTTFLHTFMCACMACLSLQADSARAYSGGKSNARNKNGRPRQAKSLCT